MSLHAVLETLKNQLELVFIALSFYSRLPVPKWLECSLQKLNAFCLRLLCISPRKINSSLTRRDSCNFNVL